MKNVGIIKRLLAGIYGNGYRRSLDVYFKCRVLMAIVVIGIYLGFKREFSKLIGFLVVALIAVGLVFNAGGVKDVLLELFNKIIGA